MKRPNDETSSREFRQGMEQNVEKHNDSPSEEVSVNNHSRRKFLAAAGASALTMPFLLVKSAGRARGVAAISDHR